MKRFLPILTTISFVWLAFNANAQYCSTPGFATGPWTSITNVTLQTLNQTSGYPSGSGSDTGYTYFTNAAVPNLAQGQTYPISVTANDGNIMGMEIRVWIDYNGDNTFNPTTELAATWSTSSTGTIVHNGNVVVPAGATLGTTRMRVYCDMPIAGGHIAPNPCGYLNDPGHSVQQHGEVQDFDVQITTATGIDELNGSTQLGIYPNPSSGIFYLTVPADFNANQVSVYAVTGAEVYNTNTFQPELNLSGLEKGIYFIKVRSNSATLIERLIIR